MVGTRCAAAVYSLIMSFRERLAVDGAARGEGARPAHAAQQPPHRWRLRSIGAHHTGKLPKVLFCCGLQDPRRPQRRQAQRRRARSDSDGDVYGDGRRRRLDKLSGLVQARCATPRTAASAFACCVLGCLLILLPAATFPAMPARRDCPILNNAKHDALPVSGGHARRMRARRPRSRTRNKKWRQEEEQEVSAAGRFLAGLARGLHTRRACFFQLSCPSCGEGSVIVRARDTRALMPTLFAGTREVRRTRRRRGRRWC